MSQKGLLYYLVVALNLFVSSSCYKENKEKKYDDDVIVLSAISSYNFQDTNWGDDPVSKEITKRTKIALDIEYCGVNFNSRLEEMKRTGEYPDLILSADMNVVSSLISEKRLISFNDYLENDGENIKKYFNNERLFGRNVLDKTKSSDGNIYGFNKDFGSLSTSYDWYFQIQYKLLEEFDYPTINTIDDLTDLLEKYVMRHPEKANKAVLLPISEDTIRHSIANAAMRLAGNQDDGEFYVNPTYTDVTYTMTMDATHDYLKWLNKMNNKGLLSPNSFNHNHDDIRSLTETGEYLCVIEPDWVIASAEGKLKSEGKNNLCYAKLPIYFNGVNPEESRVTCSDNNGTWPSVITTSCKNPKAAMDFFDFMWSDEGQTLANWGVKGIHYDIDEQGNKVVKDQMIWDFLNDSNFRFRTGVLLYDHWQAGSLLKDESGQYYNPYSAISSKNLTDYDLNVLKHYDENASFWSDLWATTKYSNIGLLWKYDIPSNGGVIPYNYIHDNLNLKYVRDMITANDFQFEALWLEYKNKCYSNETGAPNGIKTREEEIEKYIQNLLGNNNG